MTLFHAFSVSVAAALVGGSVQAAEPLKVGVLATLEGTYTVLGEDGVRGLKTALVVHGEETARTGADKRFRVILPEDGCSTINADWHRASIEFAMTNVADISSTDKVVAQLMRLRTPVFSCIE